MYTDTELAALDAADEAFKEVRKVAERFAKEINCDYRRTVNSWTSYSSFDTPLFDSRRASWEPVNHFASDFDDAAYECAIELVNTWNETMGTLCEKRDGYIWAISHTHSDSEYYYLEEKLDLLYDAREELLDKLGDVVERWYDSACDDAYERYLEEHSAA